MKKLTMSDKAFERVYQHFIMVLSALQRLRTDLMSCFWGPVRVVHAYIIKLGAIYAFRFNAKGLKI